MFLLFVSNLQVAENLDSYWINLLIFFLELELLTSKMMEKLIKSIK